MIEDYSYEHPYKTGQTLGQVSYADLRSGKILVQGPGNPHHSPV